MTRRKWWIRCGGASQSSKNDLEANNTFTLSFYHEDPKVAMTVASRLGSFFIEGNIKSREATGKETSTFLESRLQETRLRLEQQEDKIKRYKLQFGGELPQQEQSNLNRLQRLQEQIKNNSDSIARLQDRKVFMEAQISNMERNIRAAENQNPYESVGSATQASPGSLLSELAMRRKKLEELSEKYTPLYPAVVQARWEVQQLEEKIAKMRRSAKNTKGVSPPDLQTYELGEYGVGAPPRSGRRNRPGNRRLEEGKREHGPYHRSDPAQGGTVAATGAGDDLPVA